MRTTLSTILILALLVHKAEASPLVVVVDAGHGGTNLGARSPSGVVEKDITLFVAHALARSLAEVKDVKVILTRKTDEYLTLSERVRIANRARADLFVSLHCNASPGRDQSGYEAFVLSPSGVRLGERPTARTRLTKVMASQANATEMEVDAAVADLRRAGHRRLSTALGLSLLSALSAVLGRALDRGLREGRFDVLMGLDMPGVLVELGFLDHPAEARVLTNRTHLLRMAGALAGAIRRHGLARAGTSPDAIPRRPGATEPRPEPARPFDRRRPTPAAPLRGVPPKPAVAFEGPV